MKPIKDIRIYRSRIPNINGNPLPSESHFTNDPHYATIRRIAEKYGIALEIDPKSEYHGPADMTRPQFAYLKDCIAAVYPQYPSMPFILPAGTDARTLTEICPCVLRFAPMRMNKQQYASIHGADENMDLDALVLCVDFYKVFLENYR